MKHLSAEVNTSPIKQGRLYSIRPEEVQTIQNCASHTVNSLLKTLDSAPIWITFVDQSIMPASLPGNPLRHYFRCTAPLNGFASKSTIVNKLYHHYYYYYYYCDVQN